MLGLILTCTCTLRSMLRRRGACEKIGGAMNAGLSILVPLLVMFFTLSMERVESRLCPQPRSDETEELPARRVGSEQSPMRGGHSPASPRSRPALGGAQRGQPGTPIPPTRRVPHRIDPSSTSPRGGIGPAAGLTPFGAAETICGQRG
jgi:hypothetical protein